MFPVEEVGKESETSEWDSLQEEVRAELEQAYKELKEIALMLEQSKLEVNKLAMRNASITSHLQQVQAQFDSMPRADIRMAYDAALDAQQRLFFMRGQLEKLQSDHARLERQTALMEQVLTLMDGVPAGAARRGSASATPEMLEMMIQSQESERQRLSRQMHDGPAQALSNFILQTEIAMRLFDLDQAKAREELTNLKSSAASAFQQVRNFIFDLRPMMLDDLGLVPTAKRYIEAYKEKSNLEISLVATGNERRLESYLEVMIFRALQELVSNTALHKQATQVKIHIDLAEDRVRVSIEDNGLGVDLENLEEEGGIGIKVVKDRVEMVGGTFEIDSVAGQGTRVRFEVPLQHAG